MPMWNSPHGVGVISKNEGCASRQWSLFAIRTPASRPSPKLEAQVPHCIDQTDHDHR